MRILIGHEEWDETPAYDTSRYDIRCVKWASDGKRVPGTIAEMLEQCPPNWKPDVYLHGSLGYFPIPLDIDEFEGLTAAIISDWERVGRGTWAGCGFFDVVFSERNACKLLKASGYQNAEFARLFSARPQHRLMPGVARDIDVLFVGSLATGVWEERNRWLDRLARLSDRFKVLIATGHFGEDYVRLLNRAKIVFNRSSRGETNARLYEAMACGAVVFNEDSSPEMREVFQDRLHCVYYNGSNLEALLARYLEQEDE